MSGNWGSVLTELIPLALVVTLSPLSIIPAVLVLHTPRPRPTGLAFLVGWLAGLTVLTAIFVEISSLLGGLDKAPSWASWVRIAVGAALVVFGGQAVDGHNQVKIVQGVPMQWDRPKGAGH